MTKFRHSLGLFTFLCCSRLLSAEITGIELGVLSLPENTVTGTTVGTFNVQIDGKQAIGLQEGLVAHYPFEGNSRDHSGLNNHGILQGGSRLTEDRFGRSKQALYLDGDGDWMELSGIADDLKAAFSISAWIQASPADIGTRRSFFSANSSLKSTTDQNSVLLMIGQRSIEDLLTRTFVAHDPITSNNHVLHQTAVADGKWHHIVYSTTGRIATGYVNANAGPDTSVRYSFRGDLRWSIGQEFDEVEPSDFFKGLLDEIRIYNRALSLEEVNALYHEPTFRLIPGDEEDDNDFFQIVSNQLILTKPLNFEENPHPRIRVLATGTNGQTFEKVLTLDVSDSNDPPLGVTLSPATIKENSNIGSVVGKLTAIDEDHRDTHTFTLISNPPFGYDNGLFSLSNTSIIAQSVLDYELQPELRLLIKVTDSSGASLEQTVIISVENQNDAPTAIVLEGEPFEGPANTVLGMLKATDIDPEDSHTFRIIGGVDKQYFKISGTQLLAARMMDYETQSLYQVTIRATDSKGAFVDKVLDVAIANANDPPTDILLEPNSVHENQPAKSLVGTFRQIDPDGEWTPIEDPGEPELFLHDEFNGEGISEDWKIEYFESTTLNHTVSNGKLTIESIETEVFNTDTEGDWALVTLSRDITRLADFDAEWKISWDQHDAEETIQEMFLVLLGPNEELIASIGIYDEWLRHRGVRFTSLPDNDYMTSIGSLAFKDPEETLRIVRWGQIVEVYWNKWLFATGQSEVPLAKVQLLFGESPSLINTIQSKSGTASIHGLKITGIEAPRAPSYELVQGKGGEDNHLFSIEGNRLLTQKPFNFEERSTFSIRVKGIDPGELSIEKTFTIEIKDDNDGPTAILVENQEVEENAARGTVVGQLHASDEDLNDVHRWQLLTPQEGGTPDNALFSLSGNSLRTAVEFDFEKKNTYTLDLRVTDSLGAVLERQLNISVKDANDPPQDILLSSTEISENFPPNTLVATLSAIDQDTSDKHTFQISGGKHAGFFNIKGNQLLTKLEFDYESTPQLNLRIRVTDQKKTTFEKDLDIHVTNNNDAPTGILLSNKLVAENQTPGTLVGTFNSIDPDAIIPLSVPLHFHNLKGWETMLGDSLVSNDFDTSEFTHFLLPAINAYFAPANLQFKQGRIHEENVLNQLPASPAEQTTIKDQILNSKKPEETLINLLDPERMETGSFHLYLLPFVGKQESFRALPQIASHNLIGQWHLDDKGKAVRSNLETAAIQAISAALGIEPTTQSLSTDQIRQIRLQAVLGRPVIIAGTPPPFPSLRNVDFAKVPIADQQFHIQQSGSSSWIPYATTHPITQPNTSVRRLLVMTQGMDDSLPQAWNEIRKILASEGQDEKTMLIAPQFLRSDQLVGSQDSKLLYWKGRKEQIFGGLSVAGDTAGNETNLPVIEGTRIDTYVVKNNYPSKPGDGTSVLVREMVSNLLETPTDFTFLHLTAPDSEGHGHGWGRSQYHDSLRAVDADLGLVFDLVENNPPYQGNTVLLLTADHGGGGDNLYQHTTPSEPLNFTIPFYAWGKSVLAGAELYQLNSTTRTNPEPETNPEYSANSSTQPIRNGAIGNLSAGILGLSPIPGSWINHRQDLKLGNRAVRAKYVIAISVDGLRPLDISQLGASELPNFHRFQSEGAYTHNARTDTFITRTLPNHTSMMTSRGTFDVAGTGNGHGQDLNTDNGKTIHDNSGSYIYSIFDMAKHKGLKTALYANKTKFEIFHRTWNGTWEPPVNNNPEPDNPNLQLSTPEVLDKLLVTLTQDTRIYPNLEEVVLLGHADGADFLQRYAIHNHAETDILSKREIPLRYLIFSPDTMSTGEPEIQYPYGLKEPFYPYNDVPFSTVSNLMNSRHLLFLVGENDNVLTDLTPAAMTQGNSHQSRIIHYLSKLQNNTSSQLITLHGAGNNFSQLLQKTEAIYAILGKPVPDQDRDGWTDQDEIALASDPKNFFSTPEAILPIYRLVDGDGSEQNTLFRIEHNRLITQSVLDFETLSNPKIRVQVTDPGGKSIEETFTLQVTDNNDPPTSISLTRTSIPENYPPGKWVSILTAIDQDRRDPLTFDLLDPQETRFRIRGNQLISETTFNFEETSEVLLEVRVTDNAGASLEQMLTIQIEDLNEPSMDLLLSNSEVGENLPVGTVIASLTTVDPDNNDQFSYSLVKGDGSFDNHSFAISTEGKLLANEIFDYESKQLYFFRIRSVDNGGNVIERALSMEVKDVNDPPTSLTLSNFTLEEGKPVGTEVGVLSTSDPDAGDTHIYAIPDSQYFRISGNKVLSKTVVDRKMTPKIDVMVITMDRHKAILEKTFTILITDSPDAPTEINLDNTKVQRFSRTGTMVGKLTTKDEDTEDTHTFILPIDKSHPANAYFFIKNDQLLTNHFFDENAQNHYTISVEVVDSAGNKLKEVLTISITDAVKPDGHQLEIIKIPQDGGLVTGAGYYRNGEIASIETTPSPGRHFSGHSGDIPGGVSAEKSIQFKVNSPGIITSTFAQKYYNVLVEVYPELHGFANGGGTYLHGATMIAEAMELPSSYGCQFTHWTVNGEIIDGENDPKILHIEVEKNLHIMAHFDYGLQPDLKLITAGTFIQSEKDGITPYVSSFYIKQHETTKKSWFEIYNWAISNGYTFEFDPADPQQGRNLPHADPGYQDEWPITGITWMDAVKWCNAKSEKEGLEPVYFADINKNILIGKTELAEEFVLQPEFVNWRAKGYRLPTDAEWEKAARGRLENQIYPNGPQIDESFAHFNQRSAPINLSVVGNGREPNGYGLYDMAGNAWELCWDWYWKSWDFHVAKKLSEPGFLHLDPTGPTHEQVISDHRPVRSVRGGDANSDRFRTRVDYRKDLKTWSQYAITVRPVVSGPVEPSKNIEIHTDTPHLGTISGAGIYRVNSEVHLLASPIPGTSNFLRWEDSLGTTLGTRNSLTVSSEKDAIFSAVFEAINPTHSNLFSLQAEALPNGAGFIEGSGAYIQGVDAILIGTPTAGNKFAGWAGDASGIKTTLKVHMNADKFVEGYFGDTSIDSDRDGLSDLYENSIGSNSFSSDSDDDGLRDIDEVQVYNSDPTKYDTDGDGFDDRTEFIYGTPITSADDFPFFVNNQLARYFLFKVKPYDYSGNRGHGTDFGLSPIPDRTGVNKNAFGFDGENSYFEATGYSAPAGSSARAFAFWVYRDDTRDATLLQYGSGVKTFAIDILDDHLVVNANKVKLESSLELASNKWFHVAVSVKPEGRMIDIKIMIDGVVSSTSIQGDPLAIIDTSNSGSLIIGKGSQGFFKGGIDDVRFWERYLAPSEAAKLYEEEVYRAPTEFAPEIKENPEHTTVAYGETAILKVVVTGEPAPTFQWQKISARNWVDVKGGTESTLQIPNAGDEDATNYRVLVENAEGSRVSAVARLFVMDKPAIKTSLQDVAFLKNRGGTIVVEYGGSPPLTFEWFRNDASVLQTTSNKFIIPKNSTNDTHGGSYQVKVSNTAGEVISSLFQVSLIDSVEVLTNPESVNGIAGKPISLTVEAIGGGTLVYQWQRYLTLERRWEPVQNGDLATLTLDPLDESHVGRYRCEVSNGPSSLFSRYADIGIYVPPVFGSHPKSEVLTTNSLLLLSAEASGSPPPTYQWQKQNPATEEWEDLTKMNKTSLLIKPTMVADAGMYRCVATNAGGQAFSNSASIQIHFPPQIFSDLENLTLNEGDALDLSIEATALDSKGDSITYTWYLNRKQIKDGNGVEGSSTNHLRVEHTEMDHQGVWYCELRNQVGMTQSRPIKLNLIQKPTAVRTPIDIATIPGRNAVFAASIRGGYPLVYQWSKDGVPIDGATTSKLYLRSVSEQDAGNYTLSVTNPAGTLDVSAVLTVSGNATLPSAGLFSEPVDSIQASLTDSDLDGLSNLLEFALGSDPENANSTFVPVLDHIKNEIGEDWVSFSYTENKFALDLSYRVEYSSDLKNWETTGIENEFFTRMDRGTFTEVTYFFPVQENKRFYRIRIEK